MSDKKNTPPPRRPLPSPNVSPKNSIKKAAANEAPVAPTNFYSSNSSGPPALPARPITIPISPGTTHTRYKPPSPPAYGAGESTPFREPVLVSEEPISDADEIPGLVGGDGYQPQSEWYPENDHWSSTSFQQSTTNGGNTSTWDGDSGWAGASNGNDWNTNVVRRKVPIDWTDDEEEGNWWDASVRAKNRRPGPGVLPPLLDDLLHNPEHTLFSVKVDSPDIPRPELITGSSTNSSAASSLDLSRAPSQSLSTGPQPSPASPPPPPPPPPPSSEDLRSAIPHPNAYYCRRHNGWIILQWKQSSVLPPLDDSFKENPQMPLPDQSRRVRTHSCIEGMQPWSRANQTHHFHVYEKAVNARKLTPPFHRREWEVAEKVKQKRRRMTTLNLEEFSMDVGSDDMMDEDPNEIEEGDLLDLYICCQCSLYCVASDVIPGVISSKYVDEFVRNKKENPAPGKSVEESVMSGWETVLTVLENKLWKGEGRVLPVSRPVFQKKMGWNSNILHIFEALGFRLEHTLAASSSDTGGPALFPPSTSLTTSEGRQNRAKLLRAWVEISAWVADYFKRWAPSLKNYNPRKLYVSLLAAREDYQTALGAHHNQIPRGMLSNNLVHYEPVLKACIQLGLPSTSYSPELLVFAYMAQCRCDPANTPKYFTSFYNVIQAMQELRYDIPSDLQSVVMEERSRNRYTHEDVQRAISSLGFGADGPLGLDFDDEISDEFIVNAWRDKVRRAWRDPKDGGELQRDANDSFRILAEERGSVMMRKLWEDSFSKTMNPERAYSTLEIPQEVDDTMLLTVFSLRVEEQPSQGDKMREALSVIAEVRDSARLRQFLETGTDPGEIILPTRSDLPRGLNQLGNTCYLNSLLQYFYTIKELREAVAPLANEEDKASDDEKLSDDALKRHRVGGRLVTRREVGRSKKFVSQLASLFWQLEYHQTAAITPTVELAKLALVTSRDEEDDEVDRGGTDSSNDTDATLVEDAPSRVPAIDPAPKSPLRSPGSILGKRLREGPREKSQMDVDSPVQEPEQHDKDSFIMVSKPTSPLLSNSPQGSAESSSSAARMTSKTGETADVEMQDITKPDPAKAPPLPPRKPAANSDSVMMFGKQHDVSECMDNCMFQIETALLKFDGLSGSQDGKGSIVKRLFYGKIRQRLAAVSQDSKSRSSVHEKEDLFSHLPVNVAEDGFDLYDGLSGYFDDVVEFEGKKARMEVSLVDLPPLLQVQLQRVQFNRETLQPYKSQAYVKFGETIYMDRFLDSANQSKKARSKVIQADLNNCRDRINTLTHGKHAPFSAALSSTLSFISKHEGLASSELDEDLVAQLNSEQDLLNAEIDELRAEVVRLKEELESVWRTETQAPYELTSVFVHRGSSPSWGHYFFYSRNLPDNPDAWFKYNDSDVSEVSKDEVLADTTGSTANPYLLVFARKGSEVIETVKRFDPDNLVEADV